MSKRDYNHESSDGCLIWFLVIWLLMAVCDLREEVRDLQVDYQEDVPSS